MKKTILVISDNPQICDYFNKTRDNPKYISFQISIRCSNEKQRVAILNEYGIDVPVLRVKLSVEWIKTNFDLVISAHCKQVFPYELVSAVRCINIHPGLNPHNRGWYPQVFSIINSLPAGATIHVMDEQIDHGPIIAQQPIEIFEWDTSFSAYARIIDKEKEMIDQHLFDIINNKYIAQAAECDGNYNSRSDFDQLRELDLNQIATMRDLINRLRALSHGDYKNAYFIAKNGRKVFVKIELELEKSA